jgi:single-stranded-DNA-specific exonuclease
MNWVQRKPVRPYKQTDDIITKLACIHGIDDIEEFLEPSSRSLHSPYLLYCIDEARDVIINAINQKHTIGIFADVDADGICSGALMFNYLKNFTDNLVLFYNQRSQGHGLHEALNNGNIPDNIQLLIAVDSSSNDVEACEVLSNKGIKVVIIDHHPIERENPFAVVVNCQRDNYPNKYLSGAGHVWKVLQVLDEHFGTKYADDMVDLAGVGIQADAMNMKEPENRAIVHMALENMKNKGLLAILKTKKQKPENMTSTTIGYTIAPMLNGASRLDRIDLALKILTLDDEKECLKIAKLISELNEERKNFQAEYVDMFLDQINLDDKIIVVIDHNNELGKNFTGLIAGELVNRYKRPAMVLAPSGKSGKAWNGSFRSYQGFKLRSFLESMPQDYFIFIAGHEEAGGVGIKSWMFDEWKQKANEMLKDVVFEQEIVYDLEFDVEQLSPELIYKIEQFSRINGQGMPEPKFKITNLFAMDKTLMGSKKDTVKIECDGIDLMKFRTTKEFYDNAPEFDSLEAVGSLHVNKYYHRGEKRWIIRNQLFLDDYRIV